MKESKSSLILLLFSLLLLLISLVVLSTWVYHYFTEEKQENVATDSNKLKLQETTAVVKVIADIPTPPPPVDTISFVNQSKDSLQNVYSTTLSDFDAKIDSAKKSNTYSPTDLNSKLADFYQLRNDITDLLKIGNPTPQETKLAEQKIVELQTKLAQLQKKNKTTDISTDENKELATLLTQLKKSNETPVTINTTKITPVIKEPKINTIAAAKSTDVKIAETPFKKTTVEKNMAVKSYNLMATDIQFAGSKNNNAKEAVEDPEVISGGFNIKNNTASITNAELYIVVLQPNGKILQNSSWETGSFETTEGRKLYSKKIFINSNKGETKRLNFSVGANDLQSGNYTLQLYLNGKIIGKTVKTVL
jgi:hypothetical protein